MGAKRVLELFGAFGAFHGWQTAGLNASKKPLMWPGRRRKATDRALVPGRFVQRRREALVENCFECKQRAGKLTSDFGLILAHVRRVWVSIAECGAHVGVCVSASSWPL